MLFPVKHINVSINRPWEEVYQYISNPEHLPQWAAGLSDATLNREGNDWVANSPMGRVKIRFAENNRYGIVDHDVTLPSGEVNTNPLRVIENGDGSDVVFTLFRRARMSDDEYMKDAGMIEKDLHTLKEILENEG